MRLVALSDIHAEGEALETLAAKVMQKNPDILLLGGDIATEDQDVHAVLSSFSRFTGKKAAIAGNHDIWVAAPEDSSRRYREVLPRLYHEHGFHFLDSDGPLVLDGRTAVVGNISWYDYSFRMKEGDIGTLLKTADSRIASRWENLRDDDYQRKVVELQHDGQFYPAGWNDMHYVRWHFTDEEFLEQCLGQLRGDLDAASAIADRIIVMTHHIPFENLVPRKPNDPAFSFGNAFTGSRQLGELLLQYPNVRLSLSGHTHEPVYRQNGHIQCHNIYSQDGNTFETEF